MSGLNWDVDPANAITPPALSERALTHALALANSLIRTLEISLEACELEQALARLNSTKALIADLDGRERDRDE